MVNSDSSVTLSANIHNIGTLSASNITVEFLDYGTSLGETVIGELDPNGTALASLTVQQLSSGNHLIQVLIDPANLIQESNKNNNEASQIVQIGSTPPVFAGDILVTGSVPTTVYTGSLFTISGNASYYLDVNGTVYTNYVVMGGSVLITITSATGNQWVYGNLYTDINGNFSQTIVAPTTAGTYTIAITATDYTFIGTRTLTFTVEAPPPPNQPPPTPPPPGWPGGNGSGGGYVWDPGSGSWVWSWGNSTPGFPVPTSMLWIHSSDITFSNDNPALDQEINITGQVHYWASDSNLVAQNVPIDFFVTYPGFPQVEVGQAVINSISVLGPNYGSDFAYTAWTNLAEGIYIVEVAIDPSYVQQDTANSAATRAIIVGQPLAAGEGAVSGSITSPLGAIANASITVISNGITLGNTVTDATGFYMMSNVPDGPTQINIVPPAGYTAGTPTQTVTVSEQQVSEVDFSVTATTPITALKSSLNPAKPGQKITYTAAVTPSGSNAATGSVAFQDAGVTIATVQLSNNVAAYKTSYGSIGSHSITATYSGDANNPGSTSDMLTQLIQGTSKTTVLTSGSPSSLGQPVAFTASMTSTYGSIPNGDTVNFYDGKALLGSATVSGGAATYTTSALTAKTHAIKAVYAGDENFQSSTATVTQVVVKDATTTTVSSGLSPSAYGQAVTLTAQVTTTGAIAPTGKVTFINGTVTLGSETLSATGVASLTTSKLAVGGESITAEYRGDSSNASSTSSEFSQMVNPAQITMTLTSTPNPSTAGRPVKFTATLTSNGGLPTGSANPVTFTIGDTILGTANPSATGVVTFSTTALPQGSDVVTASYAESVDYSAASASVTQNVN